MENLRLKSLSFAGYRSFAARSPVAPDRKLQKIELAPITILLGKNNSGKSTLARLLHHILLALGSEGKNPLPMSDFKTDYGTIFRDIQYGGNFFNPLDLDIKLKSNSGEFLDYKTQLIQLGDLNYDSPPTINECIVNNKKVSIEDISFNGILPSDKFFDTWRKQSKNLLERSCHLPPVRELIKRSYELSPAAAIFGVPENNSTVAQILAHDSILRGLVSNWMEENLDGWKIDTAQNLETFQLQVKRGGRDVNLADAGQGIQQVLPIVTLCCWRNQQSSDQPFLDIIEQPELHLHDAAHAALGDLLITAVKGNEGNLIVETHSEALVLRLRRRIAEGLLAPNDVHIYYVEDVGDGSQISQIEIDNLGEVDWWPEGVFSETFVEVKAIRAAQRLRE